MIFYLNQWIIWFKNFSVDGDLGFMRRAQTQAQILNGLFIINLCKNIARKYIRAVFFKYN